MDQDELYHQLFQTGIRCYFCSLSQELLHTDILISQLKCNKNCCYLCYLIKKDQPCPCGDKYIDHYLKDGRVKLSLKYNTREDTEKHFHREFKIRNSEHFQNIDYDLVNLMAYLNINPAPRNSARISAISLEEQIKKTTRGQKRQERCVRNQQSVKKKAFFLKRQNADHQETGLQSCGYQRNYSKGITLAWNSFVPQQPLSTSFQSADRPTLGMNQLPVQKQPLNLPKQSEPKPLKFELQNVKQ